MTKTDSLWNNFNDWVDEYDYKAIKVIVFYTGNDGLSRSVDEFFNLTEFEEMREYVRDELWKHIDTVTNINVLFYDDCNKNYNTVATIFPD